MGIEKFTGNIANIANLEVLDENANKHKMLDLWKDQPVVFIFLRHFACIACRSHAVQALEKRQAYEKSNHKIIFIGNGQPHIIQAFREDLDLGDMAIYTNPDLKIFYAFGFKRGFIKAINLNAFMNSAKMLKQGHRSTKYTKDQGDLWQLGGVAVVKPDGKVPYLFISEATGDFPLEEDIQATPWLSET